MRLVIERPAPAGSVYAATAFESVIGQAVTVDVLGVAARGTVAAAEVIHGGRSVKLTIDVGELEGIRRDSV